MVCGCPKVNFWRLEMLRCWKIVWFSQIQGMQRDVASRFWMWCCLFRKNTVLKKSWYLSGSGLLVSFIKKFCLLDTINYFTISVKSSLTLLRSRDYGLWMSKGQYLMPWDEKICCMAEESRGLDKFKGCWEILPQNLQSYTLLFSSVAKHQESDTNVMKNVEVKTFGYQVAHTKTQNCLSFSKVHKTPCCKSRWKWILSRICPILFYCSRQCVCTRKHVLWARQCCVALASP